MPPPLQQQQQMAGLVAPSLSAGRSSRPSSSCSGFSGGLTPQQQQQQLSSNTLLLQQAIQEGWPAPQVKAVLDQMSDEELRQLVAQQPGTAAGVLARAGWEDMQGFGAMNGAVMQQQQQMGLQQQQQQMMMMVQQHQQHQQQQAMTGMGLPQADRAMMQPPLQQQQVAADQPFRVNMTVGPDTPIVTQQEQDEVPMQQQQGPTAASAAAALAALFADTETLVTGSGGGGGGGRGSFDVSLTADQMTAAGLLNLSADSFAGECAAAAAGNSSRLFPCFCLFEYLLVCIMQQCAQAMGLCRQSKISLGSQSAWHAGPSFLLLLRNPCHAACSVIAHA
jgi:hypothetical protein